MDPKQTLIDADQAISDGDYSRAVELLGAYFAWRVRGGFEPVNQPSIRGARLGDQIAARLFTALADAIENGPNS